MKKQIFKNFIAAWFSKIVRLILALYIVPLFISELGKDGYGIVILLGTILSFSYIADVGIRSGLVRYLTKSGEKNGGNEFNEYFSTALVVYFLIFLFMSALLLIFSNKIIQLFDIPDNYYSITLLLLRTYGVFILFLSFTTPLFGAVNASYNRYDVTNYRESIIGTISIVTIITAIKFFHVGIIGWAVITVFFKIITFVTILIISKKIAPHLKFSFKFFDKKLLKEMLTFGSITFIGGWSRKMKIDVDPLILSAIFGPAVIPLYRAGVAMPGHSRPLIAALSGQLSPVTTKVFARGEHDRFRKIFETATKFTILLGTPVLVLFFVYAGPIANLWLGETLSPEDLEIVVLCMKGMALVDFCFYLEGSSYAILYAMNRLKLMTFTDLALAVTNITSSILMVNYSGLGVPSVILPTIVLEAIARPIYLFYTAGQIDYSKSRILSHIYGPCMVVLATSIIGALFFTWIIPPTNIYYLLANLVLLGIVWMTTTWLFSMSTEDRNDVFQVLKIRRSAAN